MAQVKEQNTSPETGPKETEHKLLDEKFKIIVINTLNKLKNSNEERKHFKKKKILELKNTITQYKTSLDRFNSRFNPSEEKIQRTQRHII